MSRREEVEATLGNIENGFGYTMDEREARHKTLTLTLASEVDARDAVIDKLLAMLEPEKPCPKHEDFVPFDYNKWNDATCAWMRVDDLHTRACEIAGRKK